MLHQFSAINLEDPNNLSKFDALADEFEKLPIYFMNFYGTTDILSVLDVMTFAVYTYDVKHIILDNLQFMIGSTKGIHNRFDDLDEAIEKFRKFCSYENVHVTLVIHPRKETYSEPLNINSIFGTAKATQEADNVIIIQRGKDQGSLRYLELVKNRYTGDLGKVYYKYRKDTQKYYEAKNPDEEKF